MKRWLGLRSLSGIAQTEVWGRCTPGEESAAPNYAILGIIMTTKRMDGTFELASKEQDL